VQGYNAQAVVTPEQIILAAEVTTEANDVQQLKPMLDLAQAVIESVMAEDAVLGAAAADAGYWSEAQESPHSEAQIGPNISVKTGCCWSREEKRARRGRSLCSGMVGMSS
jgi:hypothetical protein